MRPRVEVVIPVHNEENVVRASVLRLHAHARVALPEVDLSITIADNASSDLTGVLAAQLAHELPGVRLLQLPEQGRGRALRAAWSASDAEIVAYMDVDLSTDLAALAPLIRPLLAGEADVAIGSRLAPGAQVARSFRRDLISRGYNLLLRRLLGMRVFDAQCGFKAAGRAAVAPLLERVENQNWFFDTELLYLAQREGLRIFELPVRWIEDPDSSVRILRTVVENLRGIRRLRSAAARAADPAARRTPDRRAAGAGTTPG